ncbi:MAG TPA: hypothetical protein VK776_11470 [Bryobacteraceae bacterium]|nr:hypothetical protein [Bryobacteraceae bacterium]
MRYVAAWLISFALGCASGASIAPSGTPTPLTVVFQFDNTHSEKAFEEMKRELASIFKNAGIQIAWRDRDQVSSSESFPNLLVVKFHGVCKMDPAADRDEDSGPLAFTHTSDGVVLPFSEVECDQVRSSLRRAVSRGDRARSDIVLGRAMARVLAHELYHVLARTESHTANGVAQRAFSGSDLIGDQLELSPDELNSMHR